MERKHGGVGIFRETLDRACPCGRCEESAEIDSAMYCLEASVRLLNDPAVRSYFGDAPQRRVDVTVFVAR